MTKFATIRCTVQEAEVIKNADILGSRYGTDWSEFDADRREALNAGRAARKAVADRAAAWHDRWLKASTDCERAAIETDAYIEETSMVAVRVKIGGGA
jgi:hypothetical protein